jgi:hypothetical protein
MANMSDDELRQLVLKRKAASGGRYTTRQTADRLEAMQFYRGDNLDVYGDSGAGLSTVVSRDTLEAVESMLPGLVKPFVAGDETVRMEPRQPDDEEAAKQATEYLNWRFQRDNHAFKFVYDSMKDGLLSRLGVAKVVHEEEEEYEVETYEGLDQMQYGLFLTAEQKGEIEVLEPVLQSAAIDGTPLYDIRVQKKKPCIYYRCHVVAPDEFRYEERIASLDDATFLGHESRKPVGDLIAMGLPADKCKQLQPGSDEIERNDRFEHERDSDQLDSDDLARVVPVLEAYIRCDYEKRGVLEWRRVIVGGEGQGAILLLNEEADDHPFVAWTPIPLPHKLVGLSIHDLTRDIQMMKTALIREQANASYLANRPMREVVEGQVNIEDLLNPSVGGVVRTKAPGMIREIPSGGGDVMNQVSGMIEYYDTIREQRTGSTRYNQGMDADSLNKTATGISIIQNASTQRAELVARQYAEFLKGVFQKLLKLVSTHQDKAEMIRLRGQWVEIDPTDWQNGFDMSVVVGLGTGNKDQTVAHISNLLQIDQQIVQLQQGANGPLLTYEGIYNKLKRMTEAMDLKGVEQYYNDPKQGENGQQQPQQPDPEQAQADAQVQIEQQKLQMQAQTDMAKAQLESQTKIEVAKIGAEAQIIVAGMQPPPALSVGDAPEAQQEAPQEPQGEPQDDNQLHEPSYALGAFHGASAALGGDAPQPDAGQ